MSKFEDDWRKLFRREVGPVPQTVDNRQSAERAFANASSQADSELLSSRFDVTARKRSDASARFQFSRNSLVERERALVSDLQAMSIPLHDWAAEHSSESTMNPSLVELVGSHQFDFDAVRRAAARWFHIERPLVEREYLGFVKSVNEVSIVCEFITSAGKSFDQSLARSELAANGLAIAEGESVRLYSCVTAAPDADHVEGPSLSESSSPLDSATRAVPQVAGKGRFAL